MCHHASFADPILSGANVARTTHVRMSTMLLLLFIGNSNHIISMEDIETQNNSLTFNLLEEGDPGDH
jgi:hypothetical protein